MKIRYYAHACFRLESNGHSVVTDPYTPDISKFDPIREPADRVILSSTDDLFHSDPSHVDGDPEVTEALKLSLEEQQVGSLKLRGFPTRERFHWRFLLALMWPRQNAMYHITFPDGMRVLHTGDVGRPFKEEHLAILEGQVDIMLAISGAVHTIALADLDDAIRRIRPRAIIPMHYYNPKGVIPDILPVEAFTERYPAESVTQVGSPDLELDRDSLGDDMRIYVLDTCR